VTTTREVTIALEGGAALPGLLARDDASFALLVLAHGAGAGMRHPHLERLAARLLAHGVATLRYEFPYMTAGGRRPDRPPVLHAAVRAAVRAARALEPALPLLAGGRSMGGRMTSQAEAEEALGVSGLVFFAFPLHPAGKPAIDRAAHLDRVGLPMLFLSGTRDALAELALLEGVCASLGERARLVLYQGADHSFKAPKRLGRSLDEIEEDLGRQTAAFGRETAAFARELA
jgi:hypothetical protein